MDPEARKAIVNVFLNIGTCCFRVIPHMQSHRRRHWGFSELGAFHFFLRHRYSYGIVSLRSFRNGVFRMGVDVRMWVIQSWRCLNAHTSQWCTALGPHAGTHDMYTCTVSSCTPPRAAHARRTRPANRCTQ